MAFTMSRFERGGPGTCPISRWRKTGHSKTMPEGHTPLSRRVQRLAGLLSNMAEMPRLERGRPCGLGTLAVCWVSHFPYISNLVPMAGIEPALPKRNYVLSAARLPIPPHRHKWWEWRGSNPHARSAGSYDQCVFQIPPHSHCCAERGLNSHVIR